MQSLLDCKKEYTDIILDNITVPICTIIYDMYKCSMNIQEFQNKMAHIKNWNNNLIQETYEKILKNCQDNKSTIISKLLNEIILINVKLKTENTNIKLKNINLVTMTDFIHKCLINTGIYCWKNAYLFSHKNLKPSEKQYHLNIIEKNIRKIIKITIRDCTPLDLILNNMEQYIQHNKKKQQQSEEDEEESEEEEEEAEEEDQEESEEDEEQDQEESEEEEEEAEEEEESEEEEEEAEESEEEAEESEEEVKKEEEAEVKKEEEAEVKKEEEIKGGIKNKQQPEKIEDVKIINIPVNENITTTNKKKENKTKKQPIEYASETEKSSSDNDDDDDDDNDNEIEEIKPLKNNIIIKQNDIVQVDNDDNDDEDELIINKDKKKHNKKTVIYTNDSSSESDGNEGNYKDKNITINKTRYYK